MTDKQRIENLKGQVETLTAENKQLKEQIEKKSTCDIDKLIVELQNARDEYFELINQALEEKEKYKSLNYDLLTVKNKYKEQMDKFLESLGGDA